MTLRLRAILIADRGGVVLTASNGAGVGVGSVYDIGSVAKLPRRYSGERDVVRGGAVAGRQHDRGDP